MKYLCKEACLSTNLYTNHSIRATCITMLDGCKFESRHIINMSGHKSGSIIHQYMQESIQMRKKGNV